MPRTFTKLVVLRLAQGRAYERASAVGRAVSERAVSYPVNAKGLLREVQAAEEGVGAGAGTGKTTTLVARVLREKHG